MALSRVAVECVVKANLEQSEGFLWDEAQTQVMQQRFRLIGCRESVLNDKKPAALRLTLEELMVGVCHDLVELHPTNQLDSHAQWHSLVRHFRNLKEAPGQCVDVTQMGLSTTCYARLRVFLDLWEKSFTVAFAAKFGADFMIYRGDPSSSHAVALVLIKPMSQQFSVLDLVSHGRVAKMVNKTLLLASYDDSTDSVVYISLDHTLLTSGDKCTTSSS